MKVLVTGGAGYIGSTTARALEEFGHTPIILDSLETGRQEFVGDRIFYRGDVADRGLIRRIFADHPDLDTTIHMAARVVVPESVANPYLYYNANFVKSLELFDELVRLGKPRLLFSSSASVYALPSEGFEVWESSPVACQSPYARTKLMMEDVLRDLAAATDLRAVILRYFNPIGADPLLNTGVHVREPSHVLGQLVSAVQGAGREFVVTGTDYPTRDGSGIRDYIHVWDLAIAHVHAIENFDAVLAAEQARALVLNVGTGEGTTVRELIAAFERVYGASVPTVDGPARAGDVAGAFANVDLAARLLGWRARSTLEDGIDTALKWSHRRRTVLGYV